MDEALKRIVEWTKLKLRLHVVKKPIWFKAREIWWVHLGANVGDEEDGKNTAFERPMLIVKTLFGKRLLWAVPLTTSERDGDYYFRTEYHDETGATVVQYAMLAHLRALSPKRLIRKLRVLPKDEFATLLNQLQGLLEHEKG